MEFLKIFTCPVVTLGGHTTALGSDVTGYCSRLPPPLPAALFLTGFLVSLIRLDPQAVKVCHLQRHCFKVERKMLKLASKLVSAEVVNLFLPKVYIWKIQHSEALGGLSLWASKLLILVPGMMVSWDRAPCQGRVCLVPLPLLPQVCTLSFFQINK